MNIFFRYILVVFFPIFIYFLDVFIFSEWMSAGVASAYQFFGIDLNVEGIVFYKYEFQRFIFFFMICEAPILMFVGTGFFNAGRANLSASSWLAFFYLTLLTFPVLFVIFIVVPEGGSGPNHEKLVVPHKSPLAFIFTFYFWVSFLILFYGAAIKRVLYKRSV